jgi:hypothetical protein
MKNDEVMVVAAYSCDECDYYEYDEESESYTCIMDLDMDDYERLTYGHRGQCPYFRVRDEYRIVRRQN